MVKRKALLTLAAFAAASWCGYSVAQEATGLGSRWPNAVDQSRAPGLHAYRFDQGGVAYVQVNAADGSPLLAVAAGGGAVLVLPIGKPGNVAVVTSSQATTTGGTTVYADDMLTVQETSSGFQVAPASATCTDPADCTRPQVQAAKTLTTMQAADCTSPADCTRVN